MGGQPTKLKKSSLESQEPEMLNKNSLDLIYIEDFFDDPRYLKALEKHNRKIKFEASKAMKSAARKTKSRLKLFEAMSDSFLGKKWNSKAKNSSKSRSRSPKSVVPSRKATPSPKPVARPSTYSVKPPPATTSKSAGSVASRSVDPAKYIVGKSINAFQLTSVSRPRPPSASTSTTATSATSASTKRAGPSSVSSRSSKIPVKTTQARHPPRKPPSSKTTIPQRDKKNQATSSCFPSLTTCFTDSDPPTVDNAPNAKETGDHARSRGPNNSALHPSPSVKPRKQRSAFTSSSAGTGKSSTNLPHHSYHDISSQKHKPSGGKTRPTSVDRNWAPATSTTPVGQDRPRTTVISMSSQASSSKKKKLVVRGLQNYVNTHKRSRPKLWDREFPVKSKYHPDNYIYEHEGPKCPPRPCSAMAKCRKHGGRCDVCGIFTCDLCQRCRKCELDCCCPKAPPCPNPASLYSEVFGDGWKKTCKVITDLTEKDKSNPVGGTANKRKQVCQTLLSNQERAQYYQPHQIDVLNPCRTTCNDPCQPLQHQFTPPYAPFCPPPMMPYPMPSMTFMPVPMMPPPMPFYPPPPPYDPYLSAYPPSDSFMPCQNY